MPTFANPYLGCLPEKEMTNHELFQALRIDLAAEIEAIFLYGAHIKATKDPLVKTVLTSIRNEEVAHIGEIYALMRYLNPEIDTHLVPASCLGISCLWPERSSDSQRNHRLVI